MPASNLDPSGIIGGGLALLTKALTGLMVYLNALSANGRMMDRLLLVLATLVLAVSCPEIGWAGVDYPVSGQTGTVASTRAAADAVSDTPAPESVWTRDTLTGNWNGVRTRLKDAGITFSLQEESEVWANMAGGIRRGVAYDGETIGSVAVDLERMFGWTGAKFFSSALQIHGAGPSTTLVGGLQPVSGIEATRDTKLYQLWIEQSLFGGKLTIRVGQEGANDEFMTTRYGALFLNSSFGFPALAALDLPSGAPNSPSATPFARVLFKATDDITLMGAVFNGDPAPAGPGDPQLRDKGGIAFRTNAHMFAVGEVSYSINQGETATGLPGVYKLGAWFHSGHFADQSRDTMGISLANPASNGIPRDHSPNFAVYAVIDQMIWQAPDATKRGIGAFLQIMGSPGDFNLSNLFVAAGINWTGPFKRPETDVFGIAVSYLGISPSRRRFGNELVFFTGQGSPYRTNETVIEATYQIQVTPWWTLQPDLQFVVNPAAGMPAVAGARPPRNAVVTGIRASMTF